VTKPNDLAGKVALITGATRRAGIGAAIARELAHGGCTVFIGFFFDYDRHQTWGVDSGEPQALLEELRALGVEADAAEVDLAHPQGATELFDHAVRRFGHVDILINNAAHSESGGILDVTAAQLDAHYAVNTRATTLLAAEFARRKESNRGGRIINITSGQGHGPMPGEIAYVVTKAALDAMTITLSAELAAQQITVNAVDPGPTDTGWLSDDLRKASPLSRVGQPEDTAKVVRFLAGDDAAHITGQIIRVRGS